jgi:hypothetical protein
LKALGATAQAGAAAKSNWLVIFRSSDPAIWNTNVKTKTDFALTLDQVPDGMRYLRIARDKDSVIIPMTKGNISKVTDDGKHGFEGTAHFGSGARHLGVYSRAWPCKNGDVCIRILPWFNGWGFGHIHFGNDAQGYSWNGQRIAPCVFEIAVSTSDLTVEETKRLLGP